MGHRILHLIRHGQYEVSTSEGEEPDGRLTQNGREQAVAVADYLANFPIRVIHHSTLERARETAVLISESFPDIILDPSDLLRECIPSVPAGLESHFAYLPPAFVASGAKQAKDAFDHFCQPIAADAPDQHQMLVAHGNIINAFVVQAMGAPIDQWVYLDPFHCSHTQLNVLPSGKIKMIHYNNIGFMAPQQRTL